jgi:hypothetical protein
VEDVLRQRVLHVALVRPGVEVVPELSRTTAAITGHGAQPDDRARQHCLRRAVDEH